MIEEIWRPVVGYEGLYEVSNLGRVRSLDMYVKVGYGNYRLHKGKVLSPTKNKNGYLKVNLYCNGKQKTIDVHRLVTEAFLPNPDNLPQVNHKDEDKTNNRVENLEWCDHKYNMNYGTRNIRAKETAIKNGYWSSLSKEEKEERRKENSKKCYQEKKKVSKEEKEEHRKEYRKKRKDYYKEYLHKYYQDHKEERRLYMRDYQRKHKKTV